MSNSQSNPWIAGTARRWATLGFRERVMVGSAIALIAVALTWWVGISPALKQLRLAQAAAPQLDAQLQSMRKQAAEAASLKAQRALSYDESLRSLENSIKSLGVGASLSVSDSKAVVTLRAVRGDVLAPWLAQVRSNARLVPSELRLKKAAGTTPTLTLWDGSMVLSLPAR
jgi:general secretion pathway protein M